MRLPSSFSIAVVMSERLKGSPYFISSLTVSNVMSRIACDRAAAAGLGAGFLSGAWGVAIGVAVAVVAVAVWAVAAAALDSIAFGTAREAAGNSEFSQPIAASNNAAA